MLRRCVLLVLLALVAAFSNVGTGLAQQEPTDDEVNAIAKNLYCPVCPNTPLDVCETQACADWRAQIQDQLSAGWSEEEVKAYFVAQYGERVLAGPERKGFNSLIWILPVVAVALGLLIAVQVLRSWKSGRSEAEEGPVAANGAVSAEVRAQIERELHELI